jgi:hypothetical protein
MGLAAVVAAVLLAPAPDLSIPHPVTAPASAAGLDPGPFRPPELVGAGAGVLAGDALWLGAALGTFHLFTGGTVSPTASHFRNAALGLGTAALILPPLGAVLGGMMARTGPAYGAAWKAFLLAFVGQAAALTTGFLVAPAYWVILPIQLALMTAGTSVGLHWGGAPGRASEARREPAEPKAPPPVALAAPICLDQG